MRALLINLDRSPQRLAWMQAEFDRLGLQFERVTAIDGRDLSGADMERHARPRLDGEIWTPPEVACFLSHRKCWQIVADGDAEYCAIFEDDIHVGPEVAPLVSDPCWIPAGADLVKMEAPTEELHQGAPGNIGRRHRLYPSGENWVGSAGYILSKRLARRLMEVEALDCTVDQFLFDNKLASRGFVSHEIRPGICIQATVTPGYDGPLRSVISEVRVFPVAKKKHVRRDILARILRELARPWKRAYRRLAARYRELRAPLVAFPARQADRGGL
jgi:glycosyl transferase family 25